MNDELTAFLIAMGIVGAFIAFGLCVHRSIDGWWKPESLLHRRDLKDGWKEYDVRERSPFGRVRTSLVAREDYSRVWYCQPGHERHKRSDTLEGMCKYATAREKTDDATISGAGK